ncbi:MAG: GTPase KRas precursor [Candidatus Heimdallarchaeota archaeon LC_3]|nr:MAG: GTPase KRas precursor [Candidatus Heimdallarchaeota archaeon LC_3]
MVLLGDGGVGKTASIYRFIENKFKSDYVATVGFTILNKSVTAKNTSVNLQLWDMGGQKHFRKLRSNFYKGTYAALLVFDVTNLDSFNNLESWITEAVENIGHDIPFILVGNKADLELHRIVNKKMIIKRVANERRIVAFFETSALTGAGINEAYEKLALKVEEIVLEREENRFQRN